MNERSCEPSADLVSASVYRRTIGASIERVWENVRDWEHLPWLHSEAFSSIELLEGGDWGWHARVGFPNGSEAEIELVIDAPAERYVSRTLSGFGAPSEIWTKLVAKGAEETSIEVEFCLDSMPSEKLAAVGEHYRVLYAQLWSEDEQMMQQREVSLRARNPGSVVGNGSPQRTDSEAAQASLRLGSLSELRPRLPLEIDWSGKRFRIVEKDGSLWAHSVVCPHWLGPLNECAIVEGRVVCPWHGYAFDVETGESADGRRLHLAEAPVVEIRRLANGAEEVVVSARRKSPAL